MKICVGVLAPFRPVGLDFDVQPVLVFEFVEHSAEVAVQFQREPLFPVQPTGQIQQPPGHLACQF